MLRCTANDVALVLHTSGTTSRSEASAVDTQQSALVRTERGESARPVGRGPMPECDAALSHSRHRRCVLAPLSSRGSVACSPGFDDTRFFDWMRELRPTWYTAVPTIHQAVVRRAEHAASEIPALRLRFVRWSSAPLSDRVVNELEALFGVPVIDAYGMTEAAHQIASNRLSVSMRRRGTVGTPEGCEIAIMDDLGRRVTAR